jgi:hypothetical protein
MELLHNGGRERGSDNDPFLIALTFYVKVYECVTINAPNLSLPSSSIGIVFDLIKSFEWKLQSLMEVGNVVVKKT